MLFETLCDSCSHQNCCTNSAVPLVFSKDLENLKKINPDYMRHLKIVEIKDKQVYAIKKKPNLTECVFWDATLGCMIYDSRPMDCRLYPFDILMINDSYYWIVYTCNEDSNWTWSETFLQAFENYDGFDDLMENLELFSEHTTMVLPTESKKTPYKVLRKVNWK